MSGFQFATSVQDRFRERVAGNGSRTSDTHDFTILFNCDKPNLFVNADNYTIDGRWLKFFASDGQEIYPNIQINVDSVLAIVEGSRERQALILSVARGLK